jgi:dTDP-4-amino-4,6-dideoxygalactose transaminase
MTITEATSSTTARIPLADPRADQADLRGEILAAIARVIDGGTYILGREVAAFEGRFAQTVGATGAVGVASGTDALALALLAVGVSRGGEVITVSHTAGPTVAAIRMIDAIPILVDVEPQSLGLDPAALEAAVSARTRAILPVHLYGCPADLDRICGFARARDIPVVEDCAQAHGAAIGGRPVGSIADAGCFSFYPTKNLGAIGDGGAITSSRADVLERAQRLRTYGWTKPQLADMADGRCSRLDELQAAVLNVKLHRLAADVEKRRAIAERYNAGFADLPIMLPRPPAGRSHAYHLYVLRSDRRDALARHLDAAGIGTGIHYPYPVHRQPGLVAAARIPQPLTVTEAIGEEILSLPLYPSMGSDACDRVIEAVRSFFGKS